MSFGVKVYHGFLNGWWMFYSTFWALTLGFVISGFIQAFGKKEKIVQKLGDDSLLSIMRALFFGFLSSSCSYAASALTRSLIRKGANSTAAFAFMFASTNLVIEIGIVLWKLLGWQFALAELIGGVVMVLLLKSMAPYIFRFNLLAEDESEENLSGVPTLRDAANYTLGDIKMIRKELLWGFLIAGLISTLIPISFFHNLFLVNAGFWGIVENILLAPFIAIISFVCSVGNIPFAASLWNSGISFGGAISFIYADLISFPLLMIYRKYFGKENFWKILATFWLVMSLGGFTTEGIFRLFSLIPDSHKIGFTNESFGWNLDTVLNLLSVLLLIGVIYLAKNKVSTEADLFAIDPICSMQVRKKDAPARYNVGNVTYYFCMEDCMQKFKDSLEQSQS